MTSMQSLRDETGFHYLATPYSKYPCGPEIAFQMACAITAALIREGIPVFSPIAHSHPIALYGNIDPLAHDIWLPADEPMMRAAMALLVAKMPGWDESHGIGEEIKAFRLMGKPIRYLTYLSPACMHWSSAP